jgi:hypothetical protein
VLLIWFDTRALVPMKTMIDHVWYVGLVRAAGQKRSNLSSPELGTFEPVLDLIKWCYSTATRFTTRYKRLERSA